MIDLILLYILIIIVFIIFGFVIISYFLNDNVAPFVSNIDGNNYAVRKDGTDEEKQNAANYLALVHDRIEKIVNYVNQHDLPNKDAAKRLFSRWNSCQLKETSSNEKSAAYTLNKCSELRICIRKTNGEFENINTTMFVILHELAHVMSISFGHEEEFKENFSYLVHLASKLGLYKPEDFNNSPKTYCGVEINSTPCQNGSCSFR